jgi:exosortase
MRHAWALIAVGILAILGVYGPLFPTLVHEWSSFPSLSHGFAVPLIAAYLLWARRADLAAAPILPSVAGLPVLIAGLALYLLGTLSNEPFVARLSLLVSLTGVVLFLAGPAITRRSFAAIAYLFFMLPLPYVTVKGLTDDLRILEATASAAVLPWLGVPVLQNGFLLQLPEVTLEVAEVCSSVPAILSLFALGAAFGYVTRRPWKVNLILSIAAVPLGLGANVIRIVTTAAGHYYIGPIALNSVVHTWHGLSVFLLTLVALSLLDVGLSRLRLRTA